MKIRTGFVSNSSSASFVLPSFLITDEQKEMLLFINTLNIANEDEELKQKYEKLGIRWPYNLVGDYPINNKYHKILKELIENKEWHDYDWSIIEDEKSEIINGNASMDNDSLYKLMQKIGIDMSITEFVNDGDKSVRMATHPKAISHFVKLYYDFVEMWDKRDKELKQFDIDHGYAPEKICPYEVDRSKFKPWINSENRKFMEYQGDNYSYYYEENEEKNEKI